MYRHLAPGFCSFAFTLHLVWVTGRIFPILLISALILGILTSVLSPNMSSCLDPELILPTCQSGLQVLDGDCISSCRQEALDCKWLAPVLASKACKTYHWP